MVVIDPRFRGVGTGTHFVRCFPPGLVGGTSPGFGPDRTSLTGPCFVSGLAVSDSFHAVYAGYATAPDYQASIDSTSRGCSGVLQDLIQQNRVVTAMGGDVQRSDSLCEIISLSAPGFDPQWIYAIGSVPSAQTLTDEFTKNPAKQGMVITGLSITDAGFEYVAEARPGLDGGISDVYDVLAVSSNGADLPKAADTLADAGFIITASTSDGNDVSAGTTFTLVGTRLKGAPSRQVRVQQIDGYDFAIDEGFDAGFSLVSYLFDRNAPQPDGGFHYWWVILER